VAAAAAPVVLADRADQPDLKHGLIDAGRLARVVAYTGSTVNLPVIWPMHFAAGQVTTRRVSA
jgi:hypothetical protein